MVIMSGEGSGAPAPATEQVEKKEETTATAAPDAPTTDDTKPAEAGGDAESEKKPEEAVGDKAEADQASGKEAKEEAEEAKEETKAESKAESKEGESKEEEPKEEVSKEASKEASKEESKEESKDEPKEEPMEESKEESKAEEPKEAEVAADQTDSKPKDDDDNKAQDGADTEMKDAPPAADGEQPAVAADAADDSVVANETTAATPAGGSSKDRRRSGAGAEAKGKKLNRKASKAKLSYTDAKPGDYFLVKLKGYPQWPVIISDEEMLPEPLIRTRPVTAMRADGTYREDYADGGKKVNDRTFPIMYLCTNEFGWVHNSALQELSVERASELLTDRVRKRELREAFELAIERHPLDYYKDMLHRWAEEQEARRQEAEEAAEAKAAAAARKKKRASMAAFDEDMDVEMADVVDEEVKPKSSKKRKAEEAATPQRSDSVKKPKIKLTTSSTAKTANGTPTSKSSSKEGLLKSASKSKSKKETAEKREVVREPELTPEERHLRKEKEVLFLRHKLQKGLLTREQIPKEEEMKLMSDYISKLESFPDLEVSIIRATKINKVLKAILKLHSIPKEAEFDFKPRSQALLDKWNKILNSEGVATPAAPANGVNKGAEKKSEPEAGANGVKGDDTKGPSSEAAKSEAVDKSEEADKAEKADEAAKAEAERTEAEEEEKKTQETV
ncbi:hypothetical protein ACRALDRAFT_2027955 [Sodiomyces alcalophilus JCM 7366]|uniref:uncharacterized protein n=1 Tax=Sodiomyces alcalophilus JCM 7366 TaxID=591952 RepID=UPI0039B57065